MSLSHASTDSMWLIALPSVGFSTRQSTLRAELPLLGQLGIRERHSSRRLFGQSCTAAAGNIWSRLACHSNNDNS